MNGNGPGPILNGFNDWSAIKYLFNCFPSQQVTGLQQQLVNPQQQQQTSPVEHELTINDIRQSRLELLEGIQDAFERFISAPPNEKLVAFRQLVFEIQNFKAALSSEEFSPSSSSLTATDITPTSNTTTTTTTTNIPTMTAHIAQLLKTDQLGAAVGELNNLLAQVITLPSSHQSQQQQQLPEQQQQQSNGGDNLP